MDKVKILVVDDESRMRKLVSDFLIKKDYQVVEAADGQEAIDIFFEQNDISLVILDVMMPKMDGWEVLREIRSYSKIPVIMLTAKGEVFDKVKQGTGEVIDKVKDYANLSPEERKVRNDAILDKASAAADRVADAAKVVYNDAKESAA